MPVSADISKASQALLADPVRNVNNVSALLKALNASKEVRSGGGMLVACYGTGISGVYTAQARSGGTMYRSLRNLRATLLLSPEHAHLHKQRACLS